MTRCRRGPYTIRYTVGIKPASASLLSLVIIIRTAGLTIEISLTLLSRVWDW